MKKEVNDKHDEYLSDHNLQDKYDGGDEETIKGKNEDNKVQVVQEEESFFEYQEEKEESKVKILFEQFKTKVLYFFQKQ